MVPPLHRLAMIFWLEELLCREEMNDIPEPVAFRQKSPFSFQIPLCSRSNETASADRVHFSVIGRYTAWRAGR